MDQIETKDENDVIFTCHTCLDRCTVTIGEGTLDSELMIVSESPSREDCETGQILSGKVGRELDKMLRRAGTDRSAFYITTAIKRRIVNNNGKTRSPRADEINACKPLLHRQIMTINPSKILLLGMVPVKATIPPIMRRLKGYHFSLKEIRGNFFDVTIMSGTYRVMPTYQPSSSNLRLFPFIESDIERFLRRRMC